MYVVHKEEVTLIKDFGEYKNYDYNYKLKIIIIIIN